MAGEAAQWRTTATAIFAAFGDAVYDVTVKVYSGAASFDVASQRNVQTGTNTTAKLAFVMLGQTKFQKVFGPTAAYAESHKTAYISQLASGTPKIKDEVTVGSDKYVIDRLADPSGIGAYFVVYLRPVKNV